MYFVSTVETFKYSSDSYNNSFRKESTDYSLGKHTIWKGSSPEDKECRQVETLKNNNRDKRFKKKKKKKIDNSEAGTFSSFSWTRAWGL